MVGLILSNKIPFKLLNISSGGTMWPPHRHLSHKSDFFWSPGPFAVACLYSILPPVLDCCLLFGDFCSHTYWAFCLHESACCSPHHPAPSKNLPQLTDPVHQVSALVLACRATCHLSFQGPPLLSHGPCADGIRFVCLVSVCPS